MIDSSLSIEWSAANQAHLVVELERIRAYLDAAAAGTPPLVREPPEAAGMTHPPAIDVVTGQFGLTPFERDVLLLCAGVELDKEFAAACAAAQGRDGRGQPTFSLATAALPDAHWSAISPGAPLRHWRLIELGQGDMLATRPLRIDERVLHHLMGVNDLDDRIEPLVRPAAEPAPLSHSHDEIARRLVAIWADAPDRWPPVHLCGPAEAGSEAIAAQACADLGLTLHVMRSTAVPLGTTERQALARLWEREALFSDSALVIACDPADPPDSLRAAAAFIESLHGAVLLQGSDPLPIAIKSIVRMDVPYPEPAEQRDLWRDALGEEMAAHVGDQPIARIASHFSFGSDTIDRVCAAARPALSRGALPQHASNQLWQACRTQSRARLDDLAQRIDPVAEWNDLVLPEAVSRTLHDIVVHARHRATVYEKWGFGRRQARGLGINALFEGPSGTGKTLAAEVIAHELALDLYRIDLSAVVSKYIGETEKNLRRVFDAAESGGAVLLFDEADALFGKRSEVRDSHDRYANIEVSYLLQRMEAYRGLAILTTNLKQSLDTAFLRRLRFIVHFPFPGAAERIEIWRRAFPPETQTEGLDLTRLAQLNVAGGHIRNIALGAAFAAADAGDPVGMAHVLTAARNEYAKLERPLTSSELGGW